MSQRKTLVTGSVACALLLVLGATAAAQEAATAPNKAFVEIGLGYGYVMSNRDFIETQNGTALEGPHAGGPALDVAGGYVLVPNLAIIADLQHSWASSIRGLDEDGDTEQYSVSYTSFGVGLRASVPVGPGEVYSQLALGMSFPFETEVYEERGNNETRTTTVGYNSGLGARGEMGYHYPISDAMYLGAGLRLQAFSTDNAGKERVRVDQPSGDVERDVYTTNPQANGPDAEAFSVQDLRLRLSFGLSF